MWKRYLPICKIVRLGLMCLLFTFVPRSLVMILKYFLIYGKTLKLTVIVTWLLTLIAPWFILCSYNRKASTIKNFWRLLECEGIQNCSQLQRPFARFSLLELLLWSVMSLFWMRVAFVVVYGESNINFFLDWVQVYDV